MIPRKIHYCWFGGGRKPKLALKCIESWRKYCPDYELVEWNEENFNINVNRYVQQAYTQKKYAFVSDYARLHAMYAYGGIYMDTDVEVVRPLDVLLENQAFAGFELPQYISTCIMACKPRYALFKEFMDYYENRSFLKDNGLLDTTTNVSIITDIMEKYGLKKDGAMQALAGCTLYPQEYFCPLDDATGELYRTPNTYTIHWFSKSWIDPQYRFRSKITRVFHRMFGKECFSWLKQYGFH